MNITNPVPLNTGIGVTFGVGGMGGGAGCTNTVAVAKPLVIGSVLLADTLTTALIISSVLLDVGAFLAERPTRERLIRCRT